MKGRKKVNKDAIKVKGFFHVHIVNPDGTIAGDSGRLPNVITQVGFQDYLAGLVQSGVAASKQVTHVALGTGTDAVNSTTTQLQGEVMSSTKRQAITTGITSSTRAQITATFASAFLSTTATLGNIGLYNSSSAGSLMCGNTYATSTCASNQAVNITYQLNFT